MQLEELRQRTSGLVEGVARFARLERNLAALCVLTPALLWLSDSSTVRDSISAYYDMDQSQLFYVPLTIAAMLFVVNGVLKRAHGYNTYLGVMLLGVLLFDHQDFRVLHGLFAAGFFLGNVVVIVLFARETPKYFRIVFVGVIVAAVLAWWPLRWYHLFWAEWLSLAAIGAHYVLDSLRTVSYHAAERGAPARVRQP